ncbi:MAG TPA: long-chain-acyl-CoA synthetase [Stellaceae bacterium]|nr:long-chain-acyl-CoA synthetase [Stellaceae bacterium]
MPDDGSFQPSPVPSGSGAALKAWIRALAAVKILDQSPETTLPALLDRLGDQHADRPALLGEGQYLSYRALAAQSNRIARWAVAQGFAAGSVVGLLMPNCPDYVAIWLGLTRAGCVVALINTNHAADALLHSIRIAGATQMIVAGALLPALAALADRLPPDTRLWVRGEGPDGDAPQFESEIARFSAAPVSPAERALPAPKDLALLIYTSGTTGAPKAARVTHGRIVEWSFWFAGMMNAQPDDRLYDCLPLYHSTGGVVAIGAMLVKGGSVLIRARFSASRFWDDVADGNCTIFQYIGELCRYLVASPPHPRERQHRLRLACGNGLQGDVWSAFAPRFAVPHILEFYAATEGSVSLYNCEGKPGAIGRVPPFLAQRFPIALVRCDAEIGVPLRDNEGRCIACGPDQVGEAIGKILVSSGSPARQFDGYTDDAATERKLLADVFVAGDRWFRTGDLMRKDANGYFYFVDRIGDTFRWKGENVATTEVASVLRAAPGVIDAVAYGVTVSGHEGRAGMAAIAADERFDLAGLWAHLDARLPGYAQPLFLRMVAELDLTGTFKLTSGRLAKEGYAASTADPVWFNDRAAKRFIACDAELLKAIAQGTKRL